MELVCPERAVGDLWFSGYTRDVEGERERQVSRSGRASKEREIARDRRSVEYPRGRQ